MFIQICKMDSNSTLAVWQLIATIALGLLTIWTYFRISTINSRTTSFSRLDDELNNIVNTWVKYPYLEDDDFITSYHSNQAEKSESLRYDAYCTLNFNFIESLYKHFKANKRKMAAYNEYKEIIVQHQLWWKQNQADELTAYTGDFRAFVEEVIESN
jgi:hypothetical protein